ncbi:MAG: hypothetical protein AB1540_01775 [Bdellovibrionota bacterium]
MHASSSVSNATQHTKSALHLLNDWLKFKAGAQKQKAKRVSVQLAVTIVFGLLVLVWAEIALYLAISNAVGSAWAAFLVLLFNAAVVAAVNFAIRAKQREFTHSTQYIEGESKPQQAKHEMIAAKDSIVLPAQEIFEQRIAKPLNRYRRPAAVVGTFVLGLVLSKALFPSHSLSRDLDRYKEQRGRFGSADLNSLI